MFFCQPQAVYACPLLDEAAAPAVHPPAEAGVPDVVGHQEEQDEGQQGGRQQLKFSSGFNTLITLRVAIPMVYKRYLDHLVW